MADEQNGGDIFDVARAIADASPSSLTLEQRDARSKGLGGSDIGAMLGLSKYKTPMDLWAEKSGHKEPERVTSEAAECGILLEASVCELFRRRTGKKLRRKNKTVAHREYPWMLANIDRDVVGERAGFEAKTASAWLQQEWGESETDDVPLYYLTQCVHYMEVYDYDRWYVGVLIGGQDFRWYTIERNVTIADNLIAQERAFWQSVLDKVPPPPVKYQDLQTLYPKDKGGVIVATEACLSILSEYVKIKDETEKLDKERELLRMGIASYMGEASKLLSPTGDTLVTWKAHQQKRIDTTAMQDATGTLAEFIEHNEPSLGHSPRIADLAKAYRKVIDVRPLRVV